MKVLTILTAAALTLAAASASAGGITVINQGCASGDAKALRCVITKGWVDPTDQHYAANADLDKFLVDGKIPPRSALGTRPLS